MLYVARVAEVSVAAATTVTLLQVAPGANAVVRLKRVQISFKDAVATDSPVKVDLLRQTTSGTASSLTLVNWRAENSKTATFTATQTFTAEPTAGDILETWDILPYGGLYVEKFAPGEEPTVISYRLALRVTTFTGQAQTVSASMLLDD